MTLRAPAAVPPTVLFAAPLSIRTPSPALPTTRGVRTQLDLSGCQSAAVKAHLIDPPRERIGEGVRRAVPEDERRGIADQAAGLGGRGHERAIDVEPGFVRRVVEHECDVGERIRRDTPRRG